MPNNHLLRAGSRARPFVRESYQGGKFSCVKAELDFFRAYAPASRELDALLHDRAAVRTQDEIRHDASHDAERLGGSEGEPKELATV